MYDTEALDLTMKSRSLFETQYMQDNEKHTRRWEYYKGNHKDEQVVSPDYSTPRVYYGDCSPEMYSPARISPYQRSPPPFFEDIGNPLCINVSMNQQMDQRSGTLTRMPSESDVISKSSDCSLSPLMAYSTNETKRRRTNSMVGRKRMEKGTRPFKAYPGDTMELANGHASVDALIQKNSVVEYGNYRSKMLKGTIAVTNPNMRRTIKTNIKSTDDALMDTDSKDPVYTEKRMKNNLAAKKSRDKRRIKEDELAVRASFLEEENLKLKMELASISRKLLNSQQNYKI